MKLAATIGANLVALICVLIAGYLASKGMSDWGWFLLVAICAVGACYSK